MVSAGAAYHYLVVSRERSSHFHPHLATAIETRSGQTVHLHKVADQDSGEVRLYRYSEAQAEKDQGILRRVAERSEGELQRLHEGLSPPGTRKNLDHV